MRKLFFDFLKKSELTIFGPKYLIVTNTVSSGALMFIGEALAQRINKKDDGVGQVYDKEKIKQLTVVGLSQGPLHHYTYEWMERVFPGNAKSTILKKICCDQFIVSPVFITHFFYTAYFLAGKTVSETSQVLFEKKMFWTIYLADWLVWPCTQYFNFAFLPVRYRVLYINFVTMFYNVFLCFMKNRHE